MAGGKITRIAGGISKTETENFTGYYENFTINSDGKSILTAKETFYGKPKKARQKKKYFVKGWWTNHKDEPIKRAIYGQTLRFHIQMNKEMTKVGETIQFALYDSDMIQFGNDTQKKDDPIPLEYKNSGKKYFIEKIKEDHTVIIEFILTSKLMNSVVNDHDGVMELYFWCSYNNKEHIALPLSFHDYLRLGVIVIDRYKMPGLNPEGTGIAEDMAYGKGKPYKGKLLYNQDYVKQYIKEYTETGFDINAHSDFANVEQRIVNLEEVVVTAKNKVKEKSIENNQVERQEEINKLDEKDNEKAIYSKEECYNTFYRSKINIPFSKLEIEFKISTGLDVRIFDNFSNETLFWDFENTAELYFARSELQENLERMIAKFKRNEGGIYEDEVLTKAIIKNPATTEYCKKIEDYIIAQLKSNFSELEKIEDKEPYFEIGGDFKNNKETRKDSPKKDFNKPAYIWSKNWNVLRGETIALNDIWATEIILKELNFKDKNSYSAKYQVILWDHFGLNLTDMEKVFNIIPSVGETFVCWFILQHLRGYKPFITKIAFEKEFSGTLNIENEKPNIENEKPNRLQRETLNERILKKPQL